MTKATADVLAALHTEVAEELRNRIKDGSATAADISNAIRFLANNGIEAEPEVNPGLQSLARQFPTFKEGEEGLAH